MIGKISLVILCIALAILGPMVTIWIVNFLLAQMFASFIPLQITVYNWLAVFGLGMFFVGGSRS